MSVIQTVFDYKISSCFNAAYILSKYFIQKNYCADVTEYAGGCAVSYITKKGQASPLNPSAVAVTFKQFTVKGRENTAVEIEYNLLSKNILKKFLAFVFIVPAIRRISTTLDTVKLIKYKSVEICRILKIYRQPITVLTEKAF